MVCRWFRAVRFGVLLDREMCEIIIPCTNTTAYVIVAFRLRDKRIKHVSCRKPISRLKSGWNVRGIGQIFLDHQTRPAWSIEYNAQNLRLEIHESWHIIPRSRIIYLLASSTEYSVKRSRR